MLASQSLRPKRFTQNEPEIKNSQTEEQPSELVLQALAAAGGLPDWFQPTSARIIVKS